MKFNLIRMKIISLHSKVNNMVVMVTMEHKQSKPNIKQGSSNNFESQ
jgi:hypothetical protein